MRIVLGNHFENPPKVALIARSLNTGIVADTGLTGTAVFSGTLAAGASVTLLTPQAGRVFYVLKIIFSTSVQSRISFLSVASPIFTVNSPANDMREISVPQPGRQWNTNGTFVLQNLGIAPIDYDVNIFYTEFS